MSEVTRILDSMAQGGPRPAEELLPLVYDELRNLAAYKMAAEAPGHTLQATALVHEAWLRIAGSNAQPWESRRHFFAAAEAMRRIVVEAARRKKRLKHGGNVARVEIDAVALPAPMPDDELLALDEALTRLADINPPGGGIGEALFLCRPHPGAGGEGVGGLGQHRRAALGLCASVALPCPAPGIAPLCLAIVKDF